MGIARLLAKGWVVFCLFAGATALAGARGEDSGALLVCIFWFCAMGLLFAAGFGVSDNVGGSSFLKRLKPHHLIPGFNEIVFMVFLVLSFLYQNFLAPRSFGAEAAAALESAIRFAVPGQQMLANALLPCSLDGGRLFASAFAWLLAFVYLGSALSRLKLVAGLIRLERDKRPGTLSTTMRAFLLFAAGVAAILLLVLGAAYPLLGCGVLRGISGAVLIGAAPLMLSYLVVAAIASLMAANPEK